MAQKCPKVLRCLVCLSLVLLVASAARAADSETREFTVKVDGKPSGYANMTIQKQDDGTTMVSCDTNVRVRVLVVKTYVYTCQTREVWKDGRLQQLASQCNDDGKQYQVSAGAQADGVHVRVNGREHITKAEAWVSSYWTLPDAKLRDQALSVIDADTGGDLPGRLQFVGTAQIAVAGQMQNVQNYRFNGPKPIELYYDAAQRLVRQEWVEDGHPTALELARVRR